MKVRTEARREAIIDAAASVFLEMGYERASMNEVTKRMGGSKATIYSYFPPRKNCSSLWSTGLQLPIWPTRFQSWRSG